MFQDFGHLSQLEVLVLIKHRMSTVLDISAQGVKDVVTSNGTLIKTINIKTPYAFTSEFPDIHLWGLRGYTHLICRRRDRRRRGCVCRRRRVRCRRRRYCCLQADPCDCGPRRTSENHLQNTREKTGD